MAQWVMQVDVDIMREKRTIYFNLFADARPWAVIRGNDHSNDFTMEFPHFPSCTLRVDWQAHMIIYDMANCHAPDHARVILMIYQHLLLLN